MNLLLNREEELGDKRMRICKSCSVFKDGYCSKSKTGKVIKDFIYSGELRKEGEIYKGCGCPLNSKTKSESSQCPLNKW